MTSNEEILKKLDEFKTQYDLDMHGDKTVNGGKQGIVGAIREIKKFPSLTYLLVHKTKRTILSIFLVLLIMLIIVQVIAPEGAASYLAGLL